ncbi:stage II sporulation protein R [Bacillus aquiflavi]|nr:stage II sporulation protein R [Bacillus aquiflavi]UAC47936.1 stage II sporulation protein R [Bacillus aquiflavi]
MKQKTIAWSYLIILSIGTILNLYIPKAEVVANDVTIIPQEAIRLRILANSDSSDDQQLKRSVRDAVNKEITEWVADLTSIEDARELIKSRLPEIQKIAEVVVKKEGVSQTVDVDFGKVQFPTKLYGQFLYPAGEYEAILITLGNGEGANWWCVLYPPLCFLDFSNGVAVSDGFEGESNKEDNIKETIENEASSQYKQVETDRKTEVISEEKNEKKVEAISKGETSKTVETNSKEETNKPGESISKEETNNTEEVISKNETDKTVEALAEETSTKVTLNEGETIKEIDDKVNEHPVKETENVETVPLYVENDEEPIKVKFFIKELWEKIF